MGCYEVNGAFGEEEFKSIPWILKPRKIAVLVSEITCRQSRKPSSFSSILEWRKATSISMTFSL